MNKFKQKLVWNAILTKRTKECIERTKDDCPDKMDCNMVTLTPNISDDEIILQTLVLEKSFNDDSNLLRCVAKESGPTKRNYLPLSNPSPRTKRKL